MISTYELQRKLRALGFDPGPTDGIIGRRTTAAIRAYQGARGMKVDGIAGPAVAASIFGASSPQAKAAVTAAPVWFVEAARYKGLREIAGKAHNSTILGWAKALGGWVASFYSNDEIPWCGLFVAACIATTLQNEPLPKNPLSALAWADFGVSLSTPCVGAILVFKRPGGGHVGFYVGEDATHFHVLGGNQSNAVTVTRIAKSRLVATRYPSSAPAPTTGRVILASTGAISKNEA